MVTRGTESAGLPARLGAEAGGEGRVLKASGDWVIGQLDAVDAQIRSLKPAPASRIFAAEIGRIDTAGAWLLFRAAQALGLPEEPAPIEGVDADLRVLIEEVSKNAPREIAAGRPSNPWVDMLEHVGQALESGARSAVEMLGFSGLILSVFGGTIAMRRRLRMISVVHHIEATGLNAVPIVALISFLVGAVISFMSADILQEYGGAIFSVDLISFAFLREFGVLLAAIMIAGRSGSAFTAEIGAMKGHEEIDALRALALDPIEILVVPRVAALVIALPLLTFLSDMMGLVGGALVSWFALGLGPGTFVNRMLEVTSINHFWVGMIKSPFFAYLIAMIGCYQGFKVTGTAESVGERTTLSVVQSIFVVIVFDALFAMFFLEIDY